jgi:hypothetical protein
MSTPISPYNELVRQLVLPQDIRAIVEKPFEERGCPLAPETIYDYEYNELTYLSSICNNQRVVLLHIAGDVIADRNNFRDVATIAALFSSKSAGLFFFAPVKDLNREYNITLATRLKEDNKAIKEARFFDQADIESLKNKPAPLQKKLVSSLLALDALLANGNGPKSVVTTVLDLTQIQDRVIQILITHYDTASTPPRQFFGLYRSELKWPPDWDWEPTDSARESARALVLYLVRQKTYPPGVMTGYKPLGALLYQLISVVGGEEAKEIYKMIANYKLIELNDILENLKTTYCPEQ